MKINIGVGAEDIYFEVDGEHHSYFNFNEINDGEIEKLKSFIEDIAPDALVTTEEVY